MTVQKQKKTWQVMATYNKTNHIITLHVIEQNKSRKIDTKHISTAQNAIVTDIHPIKLETKSQAYAALIVVEQLSGWLTVLGLFIPKSSNKEQTGHLATLKQKNTYLMNNPKRWAEDILTVSVVDEFLIATRAPFVKVFRMRLNDTLDKTYSDRLNEMYKLQVVEPSPKLQPAQGQPITSASIPASQNSVPPAVLSFKKKT